MSLKSTYVKISYKTADLFERAKMTEHTFMIIVAIIIGVLAGFGAIAIRVLIKEISLLSYPGGDNFLLNVLHAPWLKILLITIAGGLIVGPIIYFLAPEAKGHGVPEVMQAILLKGGMIRAQMQLLL